MTRTRLQSVLTADGTALAARRWRGEGTGFVLVHGLASNLETWGEVADALNAAGHGVVAYDQRGHGRSGRPDGGYDLDTALDDLDLVLAWSGFRSAVLVGQSWGANVVLAHAARRRSDVAAIACIDGGVVDLADQFPSWDACAAALRPPSLGMSLDDVATRIWAMHSDWSERGVRATLANLVADADGTARNRLPPAAHMKLLRAIWDNPPSGDHGDVDIPVLLLLAATADPSWHAAKERAARRAATDLAHGTVVWVDGVHDLHVQHPGLVAHHLMDGGWR